MPKLTVIIGDQIQQTEVESGTLLGDAIAELELPLEQPCAGRGTCGKCKVLNEGGMLPPDAIEREHLTAGELAVGNRLACRARIAEDARVVLAPVVVYSNKSFKVSNRYKRQRDVPLGLAIDLGSTTVAAFLTMLDDGEVCAGAASLNQQSVYGADVISRLASARKSTADAGRLHRLALSSINQAIDSLKLSHADSRPHRAGGHCLQSGDASPAGRTAGGKSDRNSVPAVLNDINRGRLQLDGGYLAPIDKRIPTTLDRRFRGIRCAGLPGLFWL